MRRRRAKPGRGHDEHALRKTHPFDLCRAQRQGYARIETRVDLGRKRPLGHQTSGDSIG